MPIKPLSFAMLSDPGRVRSHNEDACAADAEHHVFVVCDGVGGAAGGEIASQLAADEFLAQVASAYEAKTSVEQGILSGISHANKAVLLQSRSTANLRGMATTLVALAYLRDDETEPAKIWLANVGDSRCYRLRQGCFEQLSQDHSVVEEQVRAGEMTREQADASPIRNVITRAIGADQEVDGDVQSLRAHPGDLYVLASDGLTRDLSDEEVAAILHASGALDAESDEAALSSACRQLVDAANEKGGGDNITCLLVQIH